MIARISGQLLLKQPPLLLIDVGGVGYEVQAPMSTFYSLPEAGEQVTVLTHLTVREDAHILYGFASDEERGLFRNLIKVNGVGPKMALTILSGINPPEFILCVQNRDAALLTRLPGIGKKTAERLVVEMQDRIDGMDVSSGAPSAVGAKSASPQQDAISALVALGYKPLDATQMVKAVEVDGGVDRDTGNSEDLIREALRAAAR